jgi:hypothetical protein
MISIRSIVISRALYTNSQEGGCLTYVGREGRLKFGKQAYYVAEVRIGEEAAEIAKKLHELAGVC